MGEERIERTASNHRQHQRTCLNRRENNTKKIDRFECGGSGSGRGHRIETQFAESKFTQSEIKIERNFSVQIKNE